jgi:hypothetical protein
MPNTLTWKPWKRRPGKNSKSLCPKSWPLCQCAIRRRLAIANLHEECRQNATWTRFQKKDWRDLRLQRSLQSCEFFAVKQVNTGACSDRFGREIVRQPTTSESCASINSSYTESAYGDSEFEAPRSGKKTTKFIGPAPDVALLRYVESVSCVEGVRQKFHVSEQERNWSAESKNLINFLERSGNSVQLGPPLATRNCSLLGHKSPSGSTSDWSGAGCRHTHLLCYDERQVLLSSNNNFLSRSPRSHPEPLLACLRWRSNQRNRRRVPEAVPGKVF